MTDVNAPTPRYTHQRALCWLCFLQHIRTHLDADSRCPVHGLLKDRVLGIVRVDTKLLEDQ